MSAEHVIAWLERFPETGGPAERIPIGRSPFVIGRSEDAGYTVYSGKVSKEHAAITFDGADYVLRDLHSTNGTFVDGQPITEHRLKAGDIIHVAHLEFCFRSAALSSTPGAPATDLVERTQQLGGDRPQSLIRGREQLRELIEAEAVAIVFQPIVDLHTRAIVGCEALARGTFGGLTANPAELLHLAEQCDMAMDLSRLLARLAVTRTATVPAGVRVFINVHPCQLNDGRLEETLTDIRGWAGADSSHPLVIEIPEASITDSHAMARNRALLDRFGMEFAYDDFGAGQARLMELTDVPPHYLKLDKTVIRGIETAGPRQEMLTGLFQVAARLGVRVIAEGVESEESALICRKLGCDLGQGYFFGRPV